MTDSSNETSNQKEAASVQIEIIPPEGAVRGILDGQGTQEPHEYHTVLWTPPAGTTREQIGQGSLATFWRITLPGGRQVLEVHVPVMGLSILYNDGDIGDSMIS